MSTENNPTLDVISSMQSIRNFSPSEITSENLNAIINSAVKAANASARQNYSIIVVTDKEKLAKYFYGGNKALIFCVDYNRLITCANHLNYKYDYYNMFGFITGSTDTILVAQTAVIAAKSLGIDSLLTNVLHRIPFEQIQKEFALPEKHCFPLISLCLGYRKEEPDFKKGRLCGPGIIHYGSYQKLSNDDIETLIKEYDDPERHLGLNYNHEFPHYLDWFYVKWSQNRYGTEKGKQMSEILKQLGFL